MWAITQATSPNGVVTFHQGGRYSLEGNTYTEVVDFASASAKTVLGEKNEFILTIQGNRLIREKIDTGISETWTRISDVDINAKIGSQKKSAGWGTPSDPDGDCTFVLSGDTLKITTPGGENPHDLAADIGVVNSPRSLQEIEGDFIATVKIAGEFAPGSQSMLGGRTPYNGAGLVLINDSENVITLARAALQRGDTASGYANFEMRDKGALVRMGNTGDAEMPNAGEATLRIQRRGNTLSGSIKNDSGDWIDLESKEIPSGWPEKLQLGVAVISTSAEPFEATFSNLVISE